MKRELIRKNLEDLITASFKGVEHYESRFFMSVCSDENIELKPTSIRDILKILCTPHLQASMSIELFNVLVKVLRAGIDLSPFVQEHFPLMVTAAIHIEKRRMR